MAEEDKNNLSIFSGVNNAINKNKRRTPKVENPGVTQNVGNGLRQPLSNRIEHVQQQFLDWQVNKIAHDLYTRTIYYDTDRVNAYQDFRAMDMSPEIAAALNIIRDECLEADTKVLLVEGANFLTIEELYNRDFKNFLVYSYNTQNKQIEECLCERVVYKGKQDVYKIYFKDDSFVMATSEHLWLDNDGETYFKTSKLKENHKIQTCSFPILDEYFENKDKKLLRVEYRNVIPENNHSIKSIEFIGKRKTYDLVNVGKHHNFAILTSNGTGVFTHNCITRGEKGKILDIFSENSRVKTVLEDLFYNRLDIDFALKLWIRDLLKYGDFFLLMHVDKDEGIYDIMALPSEEIHREEGFEGRTDDVRFRWETTGDYFEDWQVAHFRLLEDVKKLPYGRSILDPARKLWKQLQLAEDSMLVYRITRAPERKVFYIDVGNLEHADVGQFIQQFQMQLKKQPIVDQRTGNINQKYNPMNVTEDYFIPMRADRSSRIETLPGACLALDTRIPLLDGRTLELNEIIKEWDAGNKNMWVYSCDPKTGEASVGPITWAGITKKNTQVLKITLDNGKEVIATPNHKFVHRTKGFTEAENLVVGDSLMPFYTDTKKIKSNTNSDYHRVWDSHKEEWMFTHRMVTDFLSESGLIKEFLFDEKYEGKDKKIRHHKDLNRFNNNPENLVWMNGEDHMRYHQSVIKETIWKNPESNKVKITKGVNRFIKNLTKEELDERNIQSIKNLENANASLQELMKDEKYKKEFYKKTSKTLKIVKNTPEAKNRQREIAKQQWQDQNHKNKVFKVKQTLIFTETLYNMFFDMFNKTGRADLALKELNNSKEFLGEFRNKNKDIRSFLTNLDEFTYNHLEKMLKERGFKNYRDWCKFTAEELGYKNVRAWRYYIEKENKKEKEEFYNHKIISIEWLEDKIDTGTITVDGEEKVQVNHTFALESGIYVKNSNLGDIQDIEYLQNKLFASLQVPKNYLNYGESLPGGSTLSQQDLRFARTINTIQQAVLAELKRVANIHLYFNGFKDDIDNFTLTLNNPSTQQELLKLETMKARLEVFKEMFSADATSPVSYVWAMENILGFSRNEIKLMLKQKKVEKKIFAEIDSAVEMYKKIGLFRDLDDKFEIEGAEEMMAAQQSGEEGDGGGDLGGGGGGFGGGGAFGGAEELDTGDEAGSEAGVDAGAEAEAEEPISESKFRKAQYLSDKYVDNMLNELLGADEVKPKSKIEDNALINRSSSMRLDSKKLIKSLNDGLVKMGAGKNMIQEDIIHIPNSNSLIEGSEKLEKDNNELMCDIERFLKNRKKYK